MITAPKPQIHPLHQQSENIHNLKGAIESYRNAIRDRERQIAASQKVIDEIDATLKHQPHLRQYQEPNITKGYHSDRVKELRQEIHNFERDIQQLEKDLDNALKQHASLEQETRSSLKELMMTAANWMNSIELGKALIQSGLEELECLAGDINAHSRSLHESDRIVFKSKKIEIPEIELRLEK
jgi:chromosome segregation ATPase